MEFKFTKDLARLMLEIRLHIDDHDLPIKIHLNKHNWLVITIEKFGTSTISFKRQYDGNYLYLTLARQKISWMHRPYVGKFQNQITEIFESLGGVKV